MNSIPALSEHRYLRFAAFTSFYVAQGLPIGLLSIAMPAWLAGQGVEADQIGYFVAITTLPWGLKLLAGPVMDRFSYLPMGRRRPWIILAQVGLAFAILLLALNPDPVQHIGLLTWSGFLVNCCAAVQDVAVDGMAIDVLPHDERGRANAFMAFGQVAGYSGSAAICAAALARWGMAGAAVILVAGVAVIIGFAVAVRERPGEKLLPWSPGAPSARSIELQSRDWRSIFRNLLKVMFLRTSLLLVATVLFYRAADGFFISAAPVIVVQELGWADTDYSDWMALASGTAAVFGLFIGPIIDRHGSGRLMSLALTGVGIVYLATGYATAFWHIWYVPIVVVFLVQWTLQVAFIGVIAIHMDICWERVSATQFAIYMAWANQSRSIGAALYGSIAESLPKGGEFIAMGVFSLIAAAIVLRVNVARHQERLAALSAAG